jgi:hypothetical protein
LLHVTFFYEYLPSFGTQGTHFVLLNDFTAAKLLNLPVQVGDRAHPFLTQQRAEKRWKMMGKGRWLLFVLLSPSVSVPFTPSAHARERKARKK